MRIWLSVRVRLLRDGPRPDARHVSPRASGPDPDPEAHAGSRSAPQTAKVFLQPGQTVRVVIEGIGECVNTCVEEKE